MDDCGAVVYGLMSEKDKTGGTREVDLER